MVWHYCVIRKTKRIKEKIYHYYDIHEVYEDEETGELSWTEEPVDCNGMEDIKSLQVALTMMLRDSLERPVMEIRKGKLVERSRNIHENTRVNKKI